MNTHEDYSRKHEAKGPSDRSFGWVFAVFFTVLAVWPVVHGRPVRLWAIAAAALIAAIALIRPSLLHGPNVAWMRFGLLLSRIVNPVLMAVVFYGAITPMGWFRRALGKNSLPLRFEPSAGSYWIERRPPGPKPETMSQQY